MKSLLVMLLVLFLNSLKCFAQHEADIWYFGDHSGLSFQSGVPNKIFDGKINTDEACAVASDKVTGKLLFYTDGSTIWNGNHTVVANGTGLKSGSSSSQGALIVPNPANPLEYFIFTVPDLTAGGPPVNTAMYYSLISVANPACDLLIKNKLLIDKVSEKLTGTLDCSESGYWVLSHAVDENKIYAFHVTTAGVNESPVVSFYAEKEIDHTQGCMKFSPNGTKLAVASTSSKNTFLSLFDFNRLTGQVTNYNLLSNPNSSLLFYGVSFSPDNKILHALGKTQSAFPNNCGLYQYDVTLSSPNAVRLSETVFSVRPGVPFINSGMQLAPDGKLYLVSGNRKFVDVINFPNIKGIGCSYTVDAINFPNICYRGLPNFMDFIFGDHCYYGSCSIVGDTSVICLGTSIRIGTFPSAGFTYLWTPSQGLDNPNIANPIASPTKTTTYHLKSKSIDCEYNNTFTVKIAEKPTIAAVEPLCVGSKVQLSASAGDSYSWSPVEDLDTATKANPIASPKVTTQYKVIIRQGLCVDSAFVTVNVYPKINANAGPDKTICLFESVQIGDTAKPEETYSWLPPDGLSDPTIPNPIASPRGTTRYIVAAHRNGCTAYDTVVVTVALVKPIVSKDVTICKGASVQLTADGGRLFSWFPYTGLDNPKIQNPIASPSVTTKYRVLISNGKCVDSAFVTVNVLPPVKSIAGTDKILCAGTTVELGSTPDVDFTYSWQPTTYLKNPTTANPICSATSTTTYILKVTNAMGCVGYDTVLVEVKNLAANAGTDKTVCNGATTEIGTPAIAGLTYSWRPTTDLDDATKANPNVTPNITTQYILTVTNEQGCKGYDTVLVTVSNNLVAKVSSDTAICIGSSVQLLASGGSEYSWSPSVGLDDAKIPSPIATPTLTTTYTVVVSSGTCRDSAMVVVTVNPKPTANAGEDKTICTGASVEIGIPPTAGNAYSWQPTNGLNDRSLSNPIASPSVTTEYILTVTGVGGCVDFDTVLVTVGNISAKVSGDTAICEGSSVQLLASGGNEYLWSPSIGLSNPNNANPIANPTKTTTYKVVVSSGLCKDSANVTVSIVPLPIANAGKDTIICVGESVQIGTSELAGNSYSWKPSIGLNNTTISNPTASPNQTTEYILTATNSSGCINYDTVKITVNPSNERTFTLTPSFITILPGQPFQTALNVPSGVNSWNVRLGYDSLVVKFGSILQITNGITVIPTEQNGQFSLQGKGENGNVLLSFNTFLPYNSDTTFPIKLTVNSAELQPCKTVTSIGNILQLGEYCGKRIRMVSSKGKNYFLTTKENGVNFGVGLTGNVRIELYDNIGSLKEVLVSGNLEAGEYGLDFDVPTGVYFCRMSAGMFEQAVRVLIMR
ncbi:MAG: hypothetical protein JST20_07640 [Bacteroidetes bacterium]|nr:hypothetical protein [Bacteroidota bacterium]